MRSPTTVSRLKTAFTSRLRTFSLILLAGSLASHASAAVITFDDYPSKWLQVNSNGTPLVDTSVVNDVRRIRIIRNASNVGSASIFYTNGVTTATTDNQFSDFSGSLLISGLNQSSYARGVLLRSAGKTFSGGYYVNITPGGDNPGLGIFWNFGTTLIPNPVSAKAFDTFSTLSTTLTYKLTFKAEGTKISAELWSADGSGNYTNLIADVVYNNATEASTGYFGIQGGRYGGNSTTTFSDLHLTPIPEPHSIAAILLGGAMIFGAFRRQGKRP